MFSKHKKGSRRNRSNQEDGEMLRQERRTRGDPSVEGGDTGPPTRTRGNNHDNGLGSACVELTKKEGCNLGLVITGGIDKDLKPRVSYLKPGGIAHRSDVLQEGDFITAVNGIRTAMLKHEEIVNLLRNTGERVGLEIEYELPDPPQQTFSVLCKCISVTLDHDGESFGFTLRGGVHSNPTLCRPLTITQIRPGGSADREGTLKVGDRILSISGVDVCQCSLIEALTLLKHADNNVKLEVEYDVSVMDAVEHAVGPLLVEIDKAAGSPLGLTVTSANYRGRSVICIHNIKPGSIADRCGALHKGDHILAIDDTSFEHVSIAEATQILKCTTGSHVKLEIVPIKHIKSQSQGSLKETHKPPVRPVNGHPASRQSSSEPSPVELRRQALSNMDSNTIVGLSKSGELRNSTSSKGSSLTGSHVTDHAGDSDHSRHSSVASDNTSRLKHNKPTGFNNNTNEGKKPAAVGAVGERPSKLPSGGMVTDHRRYNNTLGVNGNSNCNGGLVTHDNRNNNGLHSDRHLHHSSNTSLQSLAHKETKERTYTSMTTQMGSAANSPTGTLQRQTRDQRFGGRPHRYNTGDLDLEEEPHCDSEEPRSDSSGNSTIRVGVFYQSLLAPHNSISFSNVMLPGHQVCHTEVTEVILVSDMRGFGVTLGGSGYPEESLKEPPFISFIEPRSVAERCGVLQEGDRVLTINGTMLENKSVEECMKILNNSGMRVSLLVEFDVAESIIPSSGIFNVKVAKKGSGLGITIAAPKNRRSCDPLIISDVKRGSVAHRTGTIQPGDKLLGIDNFRLEGCSIEDAAHILQETEDIVRLRLQKQETSPEEPVNMMTYTVELQRCGGPLGVTISGTEEPLDPIFISGLTEGGLAERTGALHIGDRILAINNTSLRGNTLTDAIKLLQTAGDTVTLKVTRPLKVVHGKVHDSVDSALESWDSSGLDSNGRGKQPPQLCREGSGSSTSTSHTSQEGVNTSSYHSMARPPSVLTSSGSRPQSAASYNDLSGELRYCSNDPKPRDVTKIPTSELISRLSDLGKRSLQDSHGIESCEFASSPSESVVSSAEQDEWSKQVDALDKLGPLTNHSQADSFSGFNRVTTDTTSAMTHYQRQPGDKNFSNNNKNMLNDTDFNDLSDTLDFSRSASTAEFQQGAELQIQEVETQLDHILTPTPLELHKITVNKLGDTDFGLSLSDGVYEKGVYISALRPQGPAHLAGVRPYDKVLQINSVKVKDLTCHEVVPLIGIAGHQMELVISRNPLASGEDNDDNDSIWESASMILDSKMV